MGLFVPSSGGSVTEQAIEDANGITEDTLAPALAALGAQIASPLDIDGCVLWLDASDATTINAGSPSNNDPVTTWADKSGNDFDATQATADNKPVYKTNAQNGLSVIRYDSSVTIRSLGLSGGGLSMLSNVPGVTVAAVYINRSTPDDLVGEHDIFAMLSPSLDGGENGYPRLLQCAFDSTVNIHEVFFSNDAVMDAATTAQSAFGGTAAGSDVSGSARAVVYAIDAAVAGRATIDASERLGGGLHSNAISQPSKATPGNFPAGAAHAILIGGDDEGYFSAYPMMNGDLCEIAVWPRALKARERRNLLEYLSEKWGTL